jgi:hypothetical protein
MRLKFDYHYSDLPQQYRGPGSKFMRCFETAKRNYRGPGDTRRIEIEPIRMPNIPQYHAKSYYDRQNLAVLMSGYDSLPHFLRHNSLHSGN